MTTRTRREIEETEIRARGAIADIISLLDRVPKEKLTDVALHLEQALEAAKSEVPPRHRGKKVEGAA